MATPNEADTTLETLAPEIEATAHRLAALKDQFQTTASSAGNTAALEVLRRFLDNIHAGTLLGPLQQLRRERQD